METVVVALRIFVKLTKITSLHATYKTSCLSNKYKIKNLGILSLQKFIHLIKPET